MFENLFLERIFEFNLHMNFAKFSVILGEKNFTI